MAASRAYLLWGQEEGAKQEFLERLLGELVRPEDRELDIQWVDATNAGVTGESLLYAARDRAMFSERRVVVVLNAGRLRGSRHQRTQEVLAEGLPTLPSYSTLILMAGAEDAEERRGRAPFGEALMRALREVGEVRQFSPPDAAALADLALAEAAAQGKRLHPAGAQAVARACAADSRRVRMEVAKLAAYVGNAPEITAADVAELVPAPPEENVFRLLDTALAGNRQGALAVLHELTAAGVPPERLLALLARSLRQVAQARFLLDAGVPAGAEQTQVPPEVLAELPEDNVYRSARSGWQRRRLWESARRFHWRDLQRALDRVTLTEAAGKGWEEGPADAEAALELLLIAWCAGGTRPLRPAAR